MYISLSGNLSNNTEQKATIHQVIAMLATSKNVQFPGHKCKCKCKCVCL